MKTPQPAHKAIDWHAVLGPVLAATEHDPRAVSPLELEALESATFAHVRRAIRPRPTLPMDQLPFASEPVPWFQRGRFIVDTGIPPPVRPGAFLHYAAGDYYIQDAGSMLALALCNIQPGDWVCDTCAAPGGKSSAVLESLNGQGILLANEVIRSRLAILNLALVRCGYGNHLTTNLEVEELRQLCGRAFDCVLVDAPCTGQTMVARGKQSMAAFGAVQIEHSSARQQRILRESAGLVKPAGRLVYSTCAYSFAENEQIVQDFIDGHPGWRLSFVEGLEAWQSPIAEGCYRVWPHRQGCSGAFAALLVNDADTTESANLNDSLRRPQSLSASQRRWEPLATLPQSVDWMPGIDSGQWWRSRDQLHRFDAHLPAAWIETAAVAGINIAESHSQRADSNTGERWTPSYASSLLSAETTDLPLLELDDARAIRFVAGEAVPYDGGDGRWCIATWRSRRLAWGKLTRGTLKNHFPKALRQTAIA